MQIDLENMRKRRHRCSTAAKRWLRVCTAIISSLFDHHQHVAHAQWSDTWSLVKCEGQRLLSQSSHGLHYTSTECHFGDREYLIDCEWKRMASKFTSAINTPWIGVWIGWHDWTAGSWKNTSLSSTVFPAFPERQSDSRRHEVCN